MGKHKHLTEDERYIIQHALKERKSFKKIAMEIGRDCTTISKEVRSRRVFKQVGSFGTRFNDCSHRRECFENNLCKENACPKKLCKRCQKEQCYKLCRNYEKELCPDREKPPYVCDGCTKKQKCPLEKTYYAARGAQREYEAVLSESRSGIYVGEGEIRRLDSYISPLLKNGQSIHHILANSKGKVMHSEKTIYKYVGLGLFDARNIDLRRKVGTKPRKSNHESLKVDRRCHIGRTYDDYLKHIDKNPSHHTVQMDTVHGNIGGKCLLTLHFTDAHFMLAYIMDACTADDVKRAFSQIRKALGLELYSRLFPVLLADRGSEFSDPKAIEFDDEEGEGVSQVFFCDPQCSHQKGALENNHIYVRYVIPKGKSMDKYSQQDILTMMSHINSYSRESLKDRTPHLMFELLYGEDGRKAAEKLGVKLVEPDKVLLRPRLLKQL
jgi:IS30 family transposase